jgi:hypothetical protein
MYAAVARGLIPKRPVLPPPEQSEERGGVRHWQGGGPWKLPDAAQRAGRLRAATGCGTRTVDWHYVRVGASAHERSNDCAWQML